MKRLLLTATVAAAMSVNATAAISADIQSNSSSATTFDANASSSDLINLGSSTLLSSNYSSGSTFGGTTGAHDGAATTSSSTWHYDNNVPDGYSFLTFRLDTSVNTLGYDITSIRSIYGYNGSTTAFSDQIYDVEISTATNPSLTATIANPDFSLLHAVNFDPATQVASSQVTLTDSGLLASGVTAIRFKMYVNPSNNQVGIARELDVFGTATVVPEPSTALLGGIGLLALLRRRRD